MFGLGKRHPVPVVPGPERPGTCDAEVIARAARLTLRAWNGDKNVEAFNDFILDLRSALIRSDAGRAVLRSPVPHQADPVDVLTAERDAALAERDDALRRLAELRHNTTPPASAGGDAPTKGAL